MSEESDKIDQHLQKVPEGSNTSNQHYQDASDVTNEYLQSIMDKDSAMKQCAKSFKTNLTK